MDAFDVVIVGGGVGAGACASTLREAGFEGSVALVCAEPHPPYTRPGLTKQVLRGEKPEHAALWKPEEFYREHGIELFTGAAATDLDVRGRTVRVAGRTLGYRTLVLATGAEPRSLDFGDDVRDRVHVIRSFDDARHVRPHLGDGHRWLVVGGGFIGAEFAASARLTGSDVHLVLREERILEAAFGDVVGAWFDARLRERGVLVHPRTNVARVERHDDEVRVTLDDERVLEVDHVVVGVGVAPNVGLAAQAGLELAERGVAADAHLRSSDPNVYVVGDICAFDSALHGRRVRIEHWDVARAQGAHVARQIATGVEAAYAVLPYFFGTMGDWAFLEYVGLETGRPVPRGSLDGEDMSIAFLDEDDRLTALITVGRKADLETARKLVPARARMRPDQLADDSVALADCVADG